MKHFGLKIFLVPLTSFYSGLSIAWYQGIQNEIVFHFRFTDKLQDAEAGYYIFFIPMACFLGSCIGSYIFSFFIDRVGKIRLLFWSMLFKALFYLVMACFDNFWVLVSSHFVLHGCRTMSGPAVINLWATPELKKKINLFYTALFGFYSFFCLLVGQILYVYSMQWFGDLRFIHLVNFGLCLIILIITYIGMWDVHLKEQQDIAEWLLKQISQSVKSSLECQENKMETIQDNNRQPNQPNEPQIDVPVSQDTLFGNSQNLILVLGAILIAGCKQIHTKLVNLWFPLPRDIYGLGLSLKEVGTVYLWASVSTLIILLIVNTKLHSYNPIKVMKYCSFTSFLLLLFYTIAFQLSNKTYLIALLIAKETILIVFIQTVFGAFLMECSQVVPTRIQGKFFLNFGLYSGITMALMSVLGQVYFAFLFTNKYLDELLKENKIYAIFGVISLMGILPFLCFQVYDNMKDKGLEQNKQIQQKMNYVELVDEK